MEMDDREVKLIEANAAGRVAAKVLKVLELEVPQIRSYLNRPQPNVADALACLKHIEELALDLGH
jgi:hypothetical protein